MSNITETFSPKQAIVIAAIALLGGLLVAYLPDYALLVALGAAIGVGVLLATFRSPLYGVLAVTFFLPFERVGSIDIGGSTLRISQLYAFTTIVAWLAISLAKKRLKIEKNSSLFPLMLFVGANAISLINAPNLTRDLLVFVFTLFVMLFALAMPQIIKNEKDLRRVVLTLFVTAAIVSLFGLFQFFGDTIGLPKSITGLREQYTKSVFGFPRIQSTALEPLYFANFLLLPISLGLALYLKRTYMIRRWIVIGLVSLMLLNLGLTLSRGGYLGLAASGAILACYFFRRMFSARNIVVLATVGGVVLWGLQFFLQLSGLPKAIEIFTGQATNFQEGVGVEERYTTYDQALNMWQKHPWIGVGTGNFGPSVARQPFEMPKTGWSIVNNETLEILAETGMIGLAAFVLFLATLSIETIRSIAKLKNDNREQSQLLRVILIGLFAALGGILAQYQTFSTLYILHIWFVIGLLMSCIAIAKKLEQTHE